METLADSSALLFVIFISTRKEKSALLKLLSWSLKGRVQKISQDQLKICI